MPESINEIAVKLRGEHRVVEGHIEQLIRRAVAMEAALVQISECDFNEDNCASFDVANRRLHNVARAGLNPGP
jgi:hypothetical protein